MGSFRLVTTEKLAAECQSEYLKEKYPTLADAGIQQELKSAALKFPAREKKALQEDTKDFLKQGNAILAAHCIRQSTSIRSMSLVDASLWATAVHLQGALATDEWPLTLATESSPYDEDGNCLQVLTSVHILHILEEAGKIDPKERWNMMRQWRRDGEQLHRDADKLYKKLFGEEPPTAKSPPR